MELRVLLLKLGLGAFQAAQAVALPRGGAQQPLWRLRLRRRRRGA